MPADEVLHTRGSTDQLLQATENNLRGIKRQLNSDEQQMLQQCRNYMQQARTAQTGPGSRPAARSEARRMPS